MCAGFEGIFSNHKNSSALDLAADGSGPALGQRLTAFNAEVAVAINVPSEHVGAIAGRAVG